MSEMTINEEMQLVEFAIEYEGGIFSREAGYVLHDLAFMTGIPYKRMSRIVLLMEERNMVRIERASYPMKMQANRLISITLVKGPRDE